jgi:hypothetical protein
LPIVKFRRKRWFFDERLSQLRNVNNPHEWIDLNTQSNTTGIHYEIPSVKKVSSNEPE